MSYRTALAQTSIASVVLLLACAHHADGVSGRSATRGVTSPPEVELVKPHSPAPTVALGSVIERARSAVLKLDINARLSPVLPLEWPPTHATLQFLAYRCEPLPTGVIAYAISGPTTQIVLSLPDGEPQLVPLTAPQTQQRDDTMSDGQAALELRKAQQVLVDVIMGARDLELARAELGPYLIWANARSVIADDVRKQQPALFDWLSRGQR